MSAEERFATNLRAVREQQQMSQDYVADQMQKAGYKWHQATVYKVESGAREIKLGEAQALARIVGVPISSLMLGGEHAAESAKAMKAFRDVQNRRKALKAAIWDWVVAQGSLRKVIYGDPQTDEKPIAVDSHLSKDAAQELHRFAEETIQDVMDDGPW